MSAVPFDVRLIQARLQEQVPRLRLVGLGADYAAVAGLPDFPVPCSYVLLAAERGQPQPSGHAPPGQAVVMRQMTGAMFGVATAVRNYREQRGEQLADDLRTVVGEVRAALLGFVPPVRGARAIEFVSGELKDYDASTALWVDVFQTQHFIGNTTP